MKKILLDGRIKNNIVLRPGDVVFVPSAVDGKINRFLQRLLAPLTDINYQVDEKLSVARRSYYAPLQAVSPVK